MTNSNDTSPATTAARQGLALRKIEELTRRYLEAGDPTVARLPSEEVALLETVYDVALDGLGKSPRNGASAAACARCGRPHGRTKPWNGEPEDLCDVCEKARVEEIHRIFEYHRRHPDKCCCNTYLGRSCCMAPRHGHIYRAQCIENGERFVTDFRAGSRKEAMELGQEHAAGWGGECIGVRRLSQGEAL